MSRKLPIQMSLAARACLSVISKVAQWKPARGSVRPEKLPRGQLKQSRRQNNVASDLRHSLGFLLDVEAEPDVTGRKRVPGRAGQTRRTVCAATARGLSGFSFLKGELKLGREETLYGRAKDGS